MAPLRDSKALLSPSARWAEEGNPVPCELTMSRPKSKGRAISFQQSGRRFHPWQKYPTRWGRLWVFAPSYAKNWILPLDIFSVVQQMFMHVVCYYIWGMRPLLKKGEQIGIPSSEWPLLTRPSVLVPKKLPVYFSHCCLYTGGCFSWHTTWKTCTFNPELVVALKASDLAALRRKPEYSTSEWSAKSHRKKVVENEAGI